MSQRQIGLSLLKLKVSKNDCFSCRVQVILTILLMNTFLFQIDACPGFDKKQIDLFGPFYSSLREPRPEKNNVHFHFINTTALIFNSNRKVNIL